MKVVAEEDKRASLDKRLNLVDLEIPLDEPYTRAVFRAFAPYKLQIKINGKSMIVDLEYMTWLGFLLGPSKAGSEKTISLVCFFSKDTKLERVSTSFYNVYSASGRVCFPLPVQEYNDILLLDVFKFFFGSEFTYELCDEPFKSWKSFEEFVSGLCSD